MDGRAGGTRRGSTHRLLAGPAAGGGTGAFIYSRLENRRGRGKEPTVRAASTICSVFERRTRNRDYRSREALRRRTGSASSSAWRTLSALSGRHPSSGCCPQCRRSTSAAS